MRVAAASSRVLRAFGLGENVVRIGILLSVHQPQVDLGLINGTYCCFELAILSKIFYFYNCSPAFQSICRPEIFLPLSIVFWKVPLEIYVFQSSSNRQISPE